MINRLLILLFSALLYSTMFAGAIKEGSLNANSDGTSITLRWVSEDENSVSKFVIERKAGMSGSFMLLAELLPRGNNSSYQYVDDTAFRISGESIYKYQIKIVYLNGSSSYYGPITVSHKTSDVRRTWGSIKAMFR